MAATFAILYVAGKPLKRAILFSDRLHDDEVARERSTMLMQGMANIILIGLSIWLAYAELGIAMFRTSIFWLIVVLWSYISFSVFLVRWDESARKRGITARLDELINEIRSERKSRESEGKDT